MPAQAPPNNGMELTIQSVTRFATEEQSSCHMSQAASQAAKFYREVARNKVIWTVRDKGGFPAPITPSGRRAQPFWSSRSRAEKVISSVAAYAGFEPFEISWSEFESRWVPGLTKDGLIAGVNWSGARATGYDLEPEQLLNAVTALMQ